MPSSNLMKLSVSDEALKALWVCVRKVAIAEIYQQVETELRKIMIKLRLQMISYRLQGIYLVPNDQMDSP